MVGWFFGWFGGGGVVSTHLYDPVEVAGLELPDVEGGVGGLDEHEVVRGSPLDRLHGEQVAARDQHRPPLTQRDEGDAVVHTHTHHTLLQQPNNNHNYYY